jgi:DNA-binding response OmpR family regulator
VHTGRLSTFLLVEDDGLVCELLGRMLQSSGRRILIATGEEEALEHARETHIDLLLTNLGWSGAVDVADRLRRHQPHVRVLYMSSWFDDTRRVALTDANVVAKPFTLDELEQAVASALNGG